MWNKPTDKQLAKLPPLYSTENVEPKDKIVQMHFFLFGSDWWAVEYSPEEKLFFGFVCLAGLEDCAEWGYFSLRELVELKIQGAEIDRDLFWEVRPVREVMDIPRSERQGRSHDAIL